MNSNVITAAMSELRKSHINKLPITNNDIRQIIHEHGYSIITYDAEKSKITNIFKKIGIYSIAVHSKGFTFTGNDDIPKTIFLKSTLSSQERLYVLAHELGHIALEHINSCSILGYNSYSHENKSQEDEANEFIIAFLAPICVLKFTRLRNNAETISYHTGLDIVSAKYVSDNLKYFKYKNFTYLEQEVKTQFTEYIKYFSIKKLNLENFLILLSIILSVIISFLILRPFYPTSADDTKIEPIKTTLTYPYINISGTTDVSKDANVFITKSGTKYHISDCSHIKNREVTEISTKTAVERGYQPCKDCIK